MVDTYLIDDPRLPEPLPDGPMTDKQAALLRDLTDRLDEPFDTSLTRKQAALRIEALEKQLA